MLKNPAQVAIAETAKIAIGGAKILASTQGRKSISRLSKDSIFQFPTIISSSIDSDEQSVIAKMTERNLASFIVSAISIQGGIDRTKYPTIVSFLKTIHNNTDIPAQFWEPGISVDSAMIVEEGTLYVDPNMMHSLWDIVEEQVDTELLNSVYTPYTQSKREMEVILDRIESALEAANPKEDFYQKHPGAQAAKDAIKNAKDQTSDSVRIPTGKQGNDKGGGKVVDTKTMSTAEPTLLNLSLINYNSSVTWSQDVVIGVKAMIRSIKSDVMVANMVEASKKNAIFKFIAYTKGELKVHDLLFGIKKYRELGIGTAKNLFLKSLEKRKVIDSVSKVIGARLIPNANIIITDTEAELVHQKTGVDFRNNRFARKIIDDYFLLSFGIYDTNTKIMEVMHDGENEFSSVSYNQMVSDIKRQLDLAQNNKRY